MKHAGLTIILTVILSTSCSWFNNTPNVSHIDPEFELVSFYEELFKIPPDSTDAYLDKLKQEFGQYLVAYSEGIIGIGHPDDEGYSDRLSKFLAYQPNQEVLDTCRKVFSDKEMLRQNLRNAFQYYLHYYPERNVPDVYLHISGFNQSMVVDSGWISVSVEKYLGSDCQFYEWLEIPQYLRDQMEPKMVVPDVMRALAMTEYSYNDSIDDLISQMVYHGKILHFVEHTIPDIPDSLLFGYSKDQLEWCENNESLMWRTIVENKHLFATDQMLVRKYVGEAPFTSHFGQESPGRTGRYLGYKLMESWARKHSKKSFREMMQLSDPHQILRQAGYQP